MNPLLTVEQYASLTQLHPDSVRRQLRSGRLRAVKKGRVWRIPASAVHENVAISDPSRQWAAAAQQMADVYAESLAHGSELTAMTSAAGGFAEDDEKHQGGQRRRQRR